MTGAGDVDPCDGYDCMDVPKRKPAPGKRPLWVRIHVGTCPERAKQQLALEEMRRAKKNSRPEVQRLSVSLSPDDWAHALDLINCHYEAATDQGLEDKRAQERIAKAIGKKLNGG